MQKLSIVSSVIVIAGVFVYGLTVLSSSNTCTGVRVFGCEKNNGLNLVTESQFAEIKPVTDKYLKYCSPKITEDSDNYYADYSGCDLNITINKEGNWVQKVLFNGSSLSRDEINEVFEN